MRLKQPAGDPGPSLPAGLAERPFLEGEVSAWVEPGEEPPGDWPFNAAMWRQAEAHGRWVDARRGWARGHGHRLGELPRG